MQLWKHRPQQDLQIGPTERFVGMTNATTDSEQEFYINHFPQVVEAVDVTFAAAVTGANSNFSSVKINRYDSTGASVGTLANLDFTSGVNAAKWGRVALTLNSTYTSLKAGDVLTVALVHTGTGIQLPAGSASVSLRPPFARE